MSPTPRSNSQSQVIVLSILHDGLTPTQAGLRFGMSRRHIHRLLARYKTGGLEALEPGSRRPHSNSRSLSNQMHTQIITLRKGLLLKASMPVLPQSPGTLNKAALNHQLYPPSGASCEAKDSSRPSPRNGPRHTSSALKQCNRMKPGNQISPIGDFAMAQMSRSSIGSMITRDYF